MNKIILLLGLAVAVQSCKKQLDLFPSDNINESNVFQTVTDLEQGLFAAYGAWSGENFMYVNAIVGDETKISNENRGQGQFEFKWQYVPSQGGTTTAIWTNMYYVIGIINKELSQFDNVVPKNATEETQKQQIRGELLALRALAHLELLKYYAGNFNGSAEGVVYTTTSDIAARPSRQTIGEVISGIEADLTAAKGSPLSTAPVVTGTAGVIRLSKSAIAGIQARVALYKGDWTSAESFATEAITSSGKTLASGAAFAGIWTDANENELLWKIRRTGTSTGTLWQDNNGDVFFEPSDLLKGKFDRSNDIRFSSYFLIQPSAQDTCLVNKFFNSSRGPKINDVKLMRLAEMYLIRAEARAELSNLSGSASDYNALRTARITGYVNETFATKDAAISAILDERARELCFEGFRFNDLKRRGLAINRPTSDVQSTTWQNLPASDYRFLFPVPQASILSNPNMTQNPGY